MPNLKPLMSWPRAVRLACAVLLAALTLALAWLAQLAGLLARLQAAQAQERELRAASVQAQARAGQLPQLRERRQAAAAALATLEQQLPQQQEMASLLSAINRAGLARGLQFELFKPGAPTPHTHYVAMPIAVRLRGGYHAVGAFAADLARLPRIVIIDTLRFSGNKEGPPTLDAVLRAFRLPDAQEQAAQQTALARARVKPPAMPAAAAPLPVFVPRDYSASDLPDPFGNAAPDAGRAAGGVPAPDLRRAREPLESVALSDIAMVGSVQQHGRLDALLQAGQRLHRVRTGQHLGPDHGVVTQISEQALAYREVAQDAGGVWRERRGSLALQMAGASREAGK